jgi:hypothetical protein
VGDSEAEKKRFVSTKLKMLSEKSTKTDLLKVVLSAKILKINADRDVNQIFETCVRLSHGVRFWRFIFRI